MYKFLKLTIAQIIIFINISFILLYRFILFRITILAVILCWDFVIVICWRFTVRV